MAILYYGRLVDDRSRSTACRACQDLPEGSVIKIMEPTRTLEQNALEHGIFRDISKQWKFAGRHRDEETVKRIMVHAFAKEMRRQGTPLKDEGELLISLDGEDIIQLGPQTSRFSVKETSLFIEYLNAWTAENGIELHHD